MEVIKKYQIARREKEIIKEIKLGKIFVYPTDTIYGIGCNALISKSVKKIRMLKKRDEKPFSVIVPSKKWIRENCYIEEGAGKWLKKLPGPYTLILRLKNKNAVAREVNNGAETLGARIPKHWISDFISKANVPFVTTSVNISGEKHIENINELSNWMKDEIDFVIDDGEKNGKPSTIVDFSSGTERILNR